MKKIILLFILIFTIYNFLVVIFPPKGGLKNYSEQNLITVQDYVYSGYTSDNILVGSSLSNKLDIPDSYNLSLIGEGPLTGLGLIKERGIIPKRILIESNYFLRNENKDLSNATMSFPVYYIRKVFPATRERNKPIFYLPFQASEEKTGEEALQFYNTMIEIKKAEYSQLVSETIVSNNIKQLKYHLDYFINNGTIIYFYTIPVDKTLQNTNKLIQDEKILSELSGNYSIAIIKDNNNYSTSDGEHILEKEAKRFSKIILDSIKEL